MNLSCRHIALALLALIGLSVLNPAQAQSTGSASASATIKVIQPIAISKTLDMAFGTLVRGAGTVTISNAGVRTAGGGTTALGSTSASQAQFSITGEGAQSISVTVPATFSMTSGANSLTVTTTNDMTGSASAQTLSGSLGSQGSLTVNVGGSVPLTATTPTGSLCALQRLHTHGRDKHQGRQHGVTTVTTGARLVRLHGQYLQRTG